jgi:HEAT repeat protein
LIFALLLTGLAFAGVADDVQLAADANKPLDLRQEAFARLHDEPAVASLVALGSAADTTPARRWVAVRALGLNPSPEALAALLQFLGSDNAPTRIAALAALGERKDRSTSGRVAARLEDKALLVRQAAADALAHIGDTKTLPDLGRALADPGGTYRGTSMWVRRHYVEAMGAIGTTEAIPYLAPALDDADSDVVTAAVNGLERVAGFTYKEGRTPAEEREAWRRWSKGR